MRYQTYVAGIMAKKNPEEIIEASTNNQLNGTCLRHGSFKLLPCSALVSSTQVRITVVSGYQG